MASTPRDPREGDDLWSAPTAASGDARRSARSTAAASAPGSSNATVPMAPQPPLIGATAVTSGVPVDRSREKNWQGVVALVLGCLGLALFALFAGIVALRSAERGEASNKKTAITGMILGFAVPILIVGILGATVGLDQKVLPNQLGVGDCFNDPHVSGGEESFEVETVTALRCSKAHDGQVYHVGKLNLDDYGPASIDENVFEACVRQVPGSAITPDLTITYYYPSAASWQDGDRSLVCAASSLSGKMTGELDWID